MKYQERKKYYFTTLLSEHEIRQIMGNSFFWQYIPAYAITDDGQGNFVLKFLLTLKGQQAIKAHLHKLHINTTLLRKNLLLQKSEALS